MNQNLGVRARVVRTHALPMAFILGLIVLLAFPHLSGQLVFIGDSDRLNTFLNIKLAEVIGLKEFGHISAWNPNSFLGFNMDGLYWTLPGWQPDVLLHALLPISDFIRNAGFATFSLLFMAITMAYFYIHSLVRMRLAALAGACCYGFSALSIGRLSQVDTAYYTIVLMPLGLLAISNFNGKKWRPWGVALFICISIMFGMAFLQESAYVLLLMMAYAAYVARKTRSLRPLAIFAVATGGALLLASPRVYGVAKEFSTMFRTTGGSGTNPIEMLRLLNDGIFGRSFQEAWEVVGNVGFNGHEGLQLYSSTVASTLLFLTLFLVNQRRNLGALLAFMLVIASIAYGLSHFLGVVGFIVIFFLAIFFVSKRENPSTIDIASEGDFKFHLIALSIVLALVLVPQARTILYLLFFKIDFLHGRAIVAGILPFAVIVSIVLAGIGRLSAKPKSLPTLFVLILIFAGGGAVIVLHEIGDVWNKYLALEEQRIVIRVMAVSKIVLLQASFIVVATLLLAYMLTSKKPARDGRAAAVLYVVFSSAIITEGFSYAKYRMFGEHTQTFPAAFKSYNYFSGPSDSFEVPSAECRKVLGKQLETDQFRSITLGDPTRFFAFTGPFLAQFWQQRFLDGYPGLPKALADLPWPEGVASLRSLSFRDKDDLPWELLSILGVKYAVLVSDDFYYNRPTDYQIKRGCLTEDNLRTLANPYPPIPRTFFAESITSSNPDPMKISVFGLRARAISSDTVELRWDSILRDGDLSIEKRAESGQEYEVVARFPGSSPSTFLIKGLAPGASYQFRLRKFAARGSSEFYTAPISLQMPRVNIEQPKIVDLVRSEGGRINLHWQIPPSALTVRIELRHGIMEGFKTIAEIPAATGGAQIEVTEPAEQNAIRILAILPESVSPHSDELYVGRKYDFQRPALDLLFGSSPARRVLVDGASGAQSYVSNGAIFSEFQGDRVKLKFDPIDQDRFLVVNEMFHADWRAFVNGKATPVLRSNRIMLGIPVPQGTSTVELRFEPVTRTWGVALSILFGVFAVLGGFALIAKFIPINHKEGSVA